MAGVETHNLAKQYRLGDKSIFAVHHLSISILDGSFTVIVGKSGCGKTTLLRLLGNLEEQSAGEIRYQSQPGHKRIGMVFQEPRLMPWLTVSENMAFSLWQEQNKTKVQKTVGMYLEILGLTEFKNAYPSQLSGGMAQRVALGRTLCYDPDLILLDEPFGALDYFTRQRLQRELVDLFLTQKKTIVFVTHDVQEAVTLAQKIIIMDAGTVVRELTVDLPYHREAASTELLTIQQAILTALKGHNTIVEVI